jgi:Cupin domain
VAPAHIHSANASRTILSEKGGYTNVEGERCEAVRGDLIVTPNGTWHDHGNDSDTSVIWIDMLDWPLMEVLDCAWVDLDYRGAGAESNSKIQKTVYTDGHSSRLYGHGGLKPTFVSHQRGWGHHADAMIHYRGADVREALDGLRKEAGDPYEAIQLEFVNPVTGAPVFATLNYAAQLLRPGEETAEARDLQHLHGRHGGSGLHRGRRATLRLGAQRHRGDAKLPVAPPRQQRQEGRPVFRPACPRRRKQRAARGWYLRAGSRGPRGRGHIHDGVESGARSVEAARERKYAIIETLLGRSSIDMHREQQKPADVSSRQHANELVKLIRKLRWMGMQEEADAERTEASSASSSKGFSRKINGPHSHRFHGERNVPMSRDDDDRRGHLELSQPPQQVDAAQLGHSHIGNDAACLDRGRNLEEPGGGFVCPHVDTGRSQLEREHLADRLVVVDDMDDGLLSRHRWGPPASELAG